MNTNIDKTQLFHKIKYDHRGQSRSHTTSPYLIGHSSSDVSWRISIGINCGISMVSGMGFQLVPAVGYTIYILGHIFIR